MENTISLTKDVIQKLCITGYSLVDGCVLEAKYGLRFYNIERFKALELYNFSIINVKQWTFARLKYGV